MIIYKAINSLSINRLGFKVGCLIILQFHFICCFAQNQPIKVISFKDSLPLENVLIYNQDNKKFGYTDNSGTYHIQFKSKNDTLLIQMPGYEAEKQIIGKLDSVVYLKQEIRELEEVIIHSNSFGSYRFYNPKIKNDYQTSFVSSGGALLCTVNLKRKYNKDSLKGVHFKLEQPANNQAAFIRPLIVKVHPKTKKWDFLLNTAKTVLLKPQQKTVGFRLGDFKIKFDKKYTYLIGFEVIDRNNSKNKLKVYGGKNKKSKLYLRSDPLTKWKQVKGLDYTLDYRLYFKKD